MEVYERLIGKTTVPRLAARHEDASRPLPEALPAVARNPVRPVEFREVVGSRPSPNVVPAGATLDIDCDRSAHADAAHKTQQCQKWHARTGARGALYRGELLSLEELTPRSVARGCPV